MSSTSTPRADRRAWISLAVLLLPVLLISMDIGVLYYAVPAISEDLRPSGTEQLWIMDAYGFVLAGLLVTMGAVGDRIGRRRLLLIGGAAFGGASVLAAYASSAQALIAARARLGVAGATLMPSTLALIRNVFDDPDQRRTAIACWTGGASGGVALGPILGGILLDHFWWGSVFLVNVPAAVLLLAIGPRLLPEYRAARPPRFDAAGAALSLVAVVAVVFAIKRLAVDGVDGVALGVLTGGLALGAAFVAHALRSDAPLIDVRLFAGRAFSGANLVNATGMFAVAGSGLFTSQFLQLVHGLSPLSAALYGLPATTSVAVTATLATVAVRRIPAARVIGGGLVLSAAGFALLTQVQTASPLALPVLASVLLAGGVGAALPLAADLIVAAAPKDSAGAASAISETSGELGGAVGIAILGSIGAAVYRHLADATLPAGSGSAAHATLAGAVAVAGSPGAQVVHAARDAFTGALHVVAISGAGVMLAAAVAALVLLRAAPEGAAVDRAVLAAA